MYGLENLITIKLELNILFSAFICAWVQAYSKESHLVAIKIFFTIYLVHIN